MNLSETVRVKSNTLLPFNKKYVQKSPFTRPGVSEVPDVLCQGNWAAKIDSQNGKDHTFGPEV